MPPTLNMPSFEIEQDYIEIELPPGVYGLVEINTAIKQKILILILISILKQVQYQLN